MLVLGNYIWRRKYNWHLDHFEPDCCVCKADLINIAVEAEREPKALVHIKILLNLYKYDCVVVDGYISLWIYVLLPAFKRNKTRLIMASQNYDFGSPSVRQKFKIFLLTRIYDCSSVIVVPSNLTAKVFKSHFPLRVHRKIAVLHSAINFEARKDFMKFNPDDNGVPLAAGVSLRDYACLSAALKKLPSYAFHINTKTNLFEKHFSNLDRVHLLQHSETETLLEQIRVAEFIVIPLPRDEGTSGLRILFFALELGKPIIISKTDAITEYFGSDTPFLTYEPGVVCDLVDKIELMKSDEGLKRNLSIKARNFAETKLLSSEHFRIFWETFVKGEHHES